MDNFSTLVDTLIKDEVKGITHHELVVELGDTPELLQKYAGFDPLRLVIKAKAISKIHFDHGIVVSQIKRIPSLIVNPKALYKSANRADSAVVLTFELKQNVPIIIAIHKNKRIGRLDVVNECVSMYAKEGPDPESKWEGSGLLLWKSSS